MSEYKIYPSVDEEFNFAPAVRKAAANSPELLETIGREITPKLDKEEAALTYVTPARVPILVAEAIGDEDIVYQAAASAAEGAVDLEVASRDLVEGTDERLPQEYVGETTVDVGWADKNEKLMFGLDVKRGVVFAPVVESKRNDVDVLNANTINGIVELDDVTDFASGLIYGVVDQNEKIWEPLAVDENGRHPQWVLDSMAKRMPPPAIQPATMYQPVAHANGLVPITPRSVVSGPNVVGWGHSMLAGAGGNGVSVLSVLAQETGITCYNGSVGGETSSAIVARQGGTPFMLSPVGGVIPASGSVVIPSFPIESGGSSWPLLQGAGTNNGMKGTLGGVPGEITLTRPADAQQYVRDSRDVYTFTRTTPGVAVSATRPVPFYYSFSEERRGDIAVFWMGRNNMSQLDRLYSDLQRAIQHMTALDKRFIILSDTNGTGEYTGTSNHTATTAFNKKCQDEFGRRFIDTRAYIIKYGLEDAGITPTAQDLADVAGDTIPLSFRVDAVHMNAAGYTIIGKLLAARMRELGWIK